MIKRILLIIVAALALFYTVQTSQAVLSAVDPGPYTAATGFFPLYYTDGGVPTTLDLCLSKAQSSRVPGAPGAPSYMCVLLPNPGIFDDILPIVFPVNWPDEAFWFAADAAVAGPGVDLRYVAGVEAAFGTGVPLAGDQISFARIRIFADVPTVGTYTITHPYGIEVFNVTEVTAAREIQFTRDIGVGAPGVFTGALAGDIGPFLRSVNGPYIETNPDTGALETFIGDPNLFEPVTGSPTGNNFVRVQGPGIDLTTTDFAVSGRIWNNVLPTPVGVDRSTYSRTSLGTSQIDIFATSTPTGVLTYRDTVALPIPPATESLMTGDGTGKFYGQELNPAGIPTHVIVTATDPAAALATTPTPLASRVVDVVKITRAAYALDTNTLLIEATSSDQFAPLPRLTAVGFGLLTADAFGTIHTLNASPVAKPPARVTVKSTQGGSDTEPVQIVPTINIAPVAANDTAATTQDVAVVINVVGNDTDLGGAIDPASIAIVSGSGPANGTTQFNVPSPGQVTYTPSASFFGTDTFRYTVADNVGLRSNEATVTVQVNGRPIAVNDGPFTTTVNSPIVINVLTNATSVPDSDPDGNTPLTVANLTQPTPAGAIVTGGAGGLVTFIANSVNTYTFTYQARDSLGALSNVATVTVTVGPAVNQAPNAVADSATTRVGTVVNIAVLANDTDPDGNLPLTVANLTQPAIGTGTVALQANNTVNFTPAVGFTGPATFTYQARDSLGALSNVATVTVTVAPEVITATAQARVRGGLAEWTINGTTNVPTGNLGGNVMTVRLNSINGPVIGQAVADNRGRWKLSIRNSTVVPVAGDRIAVTSRYTTVPQTFPITIR